jgi:hypothetical protein
MPHQRAGWALPNGHIVHSQSESALCEFLEKLTVAHDHWALNFEVPISRSEWPLFTPSISLTELKRQGQTILIEPINSLQIGGGVRRLQSFRKRYGADYYVIVVTRRALHRRIPDGAYDSIFDIEDFAGLADFLLPDQKTAS